MKFLEKRLLKPIGKGLSKADDFMRREMPFDMSWGFPAALAAAYFGGPAVLNAIGGSTGGSGSIFGSGEGGIFTKTNQNKLLAELLKSQMQSSQQMPQQLMTQQSMAQDGSSEFEDLSEPFYNQNISQQERNRKLLAQQLRLLKPKMSQSPQFNNSNIQSLLSSFQI
jgi:hypothetical protein